jgi:hypothetical protein
MAIFNSYVKWPEGRSQPGEPAGSRWDTESLPPGRRGYTGIVMHMETEMYIRR